MVGNTESTTDLTFGQILVCGAVNALVQASHNASLDGGWWPGESLRLLTLETEEPAEVFIRDALVAQKIALVHSEISEALEGFRKDAKDDHLPEFLSLEVELADALIRIFDLAGAMRLRLGTAFVAKMAYNKTRADHKKENREKVGGKRF